MAERPQPGLNRWRELTVPPEDLAELAGWLQELCDIRSGRIPPGSVRQRHLTAKLAAYRDLAVRGAREVAAARAACAVPSPAARPVVAAGQTAASSEADEITTAQAAALTGRSAERMRQLAAGGKVRARRTAHRAWLLDRGDVIALTGRRADGTGGGEDGTARDAGGPAGRGAAGRGEAA